MMHRRLVWELVASMLLAVLLVLTIEIEAPPAIRVPLGLLAAFGLPGGLGFLAVRRRWPRDLSEAAVALVASVGVLAVLGLVLNLSTEGLTPRSWSVGLCALSVLLAATGALRIVTKTSGLESVWHHDRTPAIGAARRALAVMATILVCLMLLSVGVFVTSTSERQRTASQHMTEFWLTSVGEQQTVHVRNLESQVVVYRLVVTAGGRQQRTETLTLSDGQEWTSTVRAPEISDEPSPFAVYLYRADSTVVYREVHVNRAPS
jgi:uncharacterized membrane protein